VVEPVLHFCRPSRREAVACNSGSRGRSVRWANTMVKRRLIVAACSKATLCSVRVVGMAIWEVSESDRPSAASGLVPQGANLQGMVC